MSFYVHIGPCAVKVGRYWIGFASFKRTTGRRRRKVDLALRDAASFG
jgi:hypothetical protein